MKEVANRAIRPWLIIEPHNFRLQERLRGRWGSCDVVVLAAFASGEDYHHERRTQEAARAVGDAVGRRARREARVAPAPGRQEPPQHVRVPTRVLRRGRRLLQCVRKGVVPYLRVGGDRERRACQDGAATAPLQGMRQALHAGDGNHLRGPQAAALRMGRLPRAAVLAQQLRVDDPGDGRSDTTHPYWMGKLFAMLDGVQDEIVLSGRVRIDETCFPVALRDAVMVDGKLLRGLSRNQIVFCQA